ncbi:hypothetical protein CPC08DRAFT_173440 [Agrocybe pediades]|nr:hypothetical protein CPC08DRAFT_173440 [Agrocybe pediades]
MCNSIRDLIANSEAIPGMKISPAWEESDEKGHLQSKSTLALFPEEDMASATTSQSQLESMQLCITTKLIKQLRRQDSLSALQGRTGLPCEDTFNYQQKTHVFVIHMADPCARLIRFDRDGAIISASFNYRDRGDLLLEFLWRFSNSNEETKGRDPTAIRATAAESALAKEKLARWIPNENHERPLYIVSSSFRIKNRAALPRGRRWWYLLGLPSLDHR